MGPEDGREDPPHPGARAAQPGADDLPGRLGRAPGSPTRCGCSPGRRGAGHIFHNQVRLSGQVPQVCLLFGPSAAGGAYIPAFCDVVIMRDGNASMYLGSPRMAQMVIGEEVTLEEMGGARMHTSSLGLRPLPGRRPTRTAIDLAQRYLSYMPSNWREAPPAAPPAEPGVAGAGLRGRPRRREGPASTSRS